MSATPIEPPAYTAPATQADLDRIIADRLSREKSKYADYADLKKKAEQFDAASEASKTELQKALDENAALKGEVTTYKTRDQVAGWAKEIVKDTPIPPEALRGSTQEELQAHFDTLKTLIPPAADPAPRKGAIAPYVPMDGTNPANPPMTPGDQFADFLKAQMQG